MKSAKFTARSVRVLLAGVAAALVLSVAPSTAQAGYEGVNNCIDSYGSMTEYNARMNVLDNCAPATSGLFPIFNINFVMPILNMMNGYFGGLNVGGPVAAYREGGLRQSSTPSSALEQLARAVNQGDGIGMPTGYTQGDGIGLPAGYTPTETTGAWISRHLQPLRDHNVNTWFNTSWSNPRDRHNPTSYGSDIWTITLGADMPILNDDLLFGMFGSFTNSDVDTNFNNGGVDSKIGTVGPYFAYTLNEYLAFDVTVAGVFGQHDNKVGASGTGTSPTARGDQEFDGFFYSMNANANYWIGNWGVQGRFGFLHSDMETDSYALRSGGMAVRIPGTNNEITQFSLASQVNYFYDKGLPFCEELMAMPFFRVTFNYDIDHDNIQLPLGTSQHPNDDDEIVVGWGVSLFGDGPISGSVEAGRTLGRSEFKSWTVSSTVNYAF
ncbi:MAG: autotransporter outer membrane beta-barrel domain-containing protein [Deltaproteobacteria bacterium]|nr:autotransporter outer membrane beta-barrel domain-containing protein [Deltaproteobacteria bacterium]MBW2447076.1 autotransporter outer membrane beta-barrel domain-containing protein [Deltaproteobacteria bacterium]